MPDATSPLARITDDEVRLGHDAESIRRDFVEKLFFQQAKFPAVATRNDHYLALAYVVRDRLLHRWIRSAQAYLERESRTVAYLSAEYLMGPQLGNALLNLGIREPAAQAMAGLGLSLDDLLEQEEEPGLGNGGLGRLAACFMDSLAALDIPAIGYGLRYEFGIFDQAIRDGWQIEMTDKWLRLGNPWEIARHEIQHTVGFGGHVEHATDERGRYRARWIPERAVKGVPHDTPVLGYGTDNTNLLRLFAAVAVEGFDLDAFNGGAYWRAVEEKTRSENLTKVLYPNDATDAGRRLRLEQQYFFVSCSLQDMIRIHLQRLPIERFAEKFAVQMNDTHPALAVVELMRLLVDEHAFDWDAAWEITTRALGYTNHTLLPEALETWPLALFAAVLPRHLEILYEVNRRFLDTVRERFPGDEARVRRMSLVDEEGERRVRMANLATVGSHCVNGVAALHSRLLRETVLKDFAELWPERFANVTNGVTPRRFVALSNPRLATLLGEAIGEGWMRDLDRLRELEPFAEDTAFRDQWRAVKLANKTELAGWLEATHGLAVDPTTLFDAQCKRIHEYKRQHLNILHAVWLHERIRRGELADVVPRTLVFAGKAAPGYLKAKLIIKLIHAVAEAVARDPVARKLLRIVFVPDFNVKVAQRIYPAADLSEQISTAGKEASGTGNMKLALNGALTLGTLDGANVEIRDAVGAESFFLFGLTAEQVAQRHREGYEPRALLAADPELANVVARIADGAYSPSDRGLFVPLVRDLVVRDEYMLLADFRSYVDAQREVARAWIDPARWTRMSILNVARCGTFSSDRSIREYARDIWGVGPAPIRRAR